MNKTALKSAYLINELTDKVIYLTNLVQEVAAHEPYHTHKDGHLRCALCGHDNAPIFESEDEMTQHDPTCPYRKAHEYVKRMRS